MAYRKYCPCESPLTDYGILYFIGEDKPMNDLIAIMTIMFWPVIPLFWIPVHFFSGFFRRIGFFTYMMPLITWVPVAYLIYMNREFLIQANAELPVSLKILGIFFLASGSLLHIWTARLLGLWGIIGVPEISHRIRENLVTRGPFSRVRHPTYSAHTLIFSGVFLMTGVIAVGILTLLDLFIVVTFIIPLEERELSVRFGESYRRYREKVPSRICPWIY